MQQSKLFTPYILEYITLRNRAIHSATFEGMCNNNNPNEMLYNYHIYGIEMACYKHIKEELPKCVIK